MSVSDYRDLIDAVFQADTSLASCAADEREIAREGGWLRNAVSELRKAVVPARLSPDDAARAARALAKAEATLRAAEARKLAILDAHNPDDPVIEPDPVPAPLPAPVRPVMAARPAAPAARPGFLF